MLDKLLSFKMPENITLSISSLTVHNHINIKIGKKAMSKLDDLLAKIATIASAGSTAEVEAEVAELKQTIAANTAAIAANAEGDEATKAAVEENTKVLEALIDKLAAAPAPTTGGDTGGDAGTGTAGEGETA